MIILNYALNTLLMILSWVVPKKKGLIILGAGNGKKWKGNPKYLYLYCLKSRPDIQPLWITSSNEVHTSLSTKEFPVVSVYSISGFWNILRAEYFFIEQSAKDISYAGVILGRFNIIQTWHGTPLKQIAFDTFSSTSHPLKRIYRYILRKEYSNYILVPSPSTDISPLLSSGLSNDNITVTGYPRNDILLDVKIQKAVQVTNELQMIRGKKVIGYIPTFRDASSSISPFSNDEYVALQNWLEENNSVFLIKKHPFQKELTIPEGLSHIYDISDTIDDIQEFLISCDILITDYSSVYFDFMLLRRPIIFYSYDLEEYMNKSRKLYFSYNEVTPGPHAKSAAELINLLDSTETWFTAKENITRYENIQKQFNHFTDSESSKRLIEYFFPL